MVENSPELNSRLAAVIFLDMVGYSAMMSRNAPKAMSCIGEIETMIRSCQPEFEGKLIKMLGDGAIVQFPTGLSAVNFARKMLELVSARNLKAPKPDRFELRIGIHLGDFYEKDGDIYGDSVNIAARVQPLADPGGIAMTGTVYSQIKNQMSVRGALMPPVKLKNIPERMKIFLIPPADTSYSLWKIRRRAAAAPIGWGAAITVCIAVSAWLYFQKPWEPVRLGLLYVRAPAQNTGIDENRAMARELEEEMNQQFSSLPEIQWVTRAGVLDLFSQEGIEDPEAIERMETKACKAARRGGLSYSLVCSIEPAGKGHWRLNSKIVCTKIRSVVGSFVSEGNDTKKMTHDLVDQFKVWLKSI